MTFYMDFHIDPVWHRFFLMFLSCTILPWNLLKIIMISTGFNCLWISMGEMFMVMYYLMWKKINKKKKKIKGWFGLLPGGLQFALQPAPLPGPRSYLPPVGQQLAPPSHLQVTPGPPALLTGPRSCLPPGSHEPTLPPSLTSPILTRLSTWSPGPAFILGASSLLFLASCKKLLYKPY